MKFEMNSGLSYNKSCLSLAPDLSLISTSNLSLNKFAQLKQISQINSGSSLEKIYGKNSQVKAKHSQEPGKVLKKALETFKKESPKIARFSSLQLSKSLNRNSLPKFSIPSLMNSPHAPQILASSPTSKPCLKYISFSQELDENYTILNSKSETKSRSWFDNILSISEFRISEKDFNENLKFCNDLVRDLIVRLKNSGNESESTLIEKIWKLTFEVFDLHLGKIVETARSLKLEVENNIEEFEKVKIENERKSNHYENCFKEFEKIIEESEAKLRLAEQKNDEFQSKLIKKHRFEASEWYNSKIDSIEPIIEGMYENFKSLEMMLESQDMNKVRYDENWVQGFDWEIKGRKFAFDKE